MNPKNKQIVFVIIVNSRIRQGSWNVRERRLCQLQIEIYKGWCTTNTDSIVQRLERSSVLSVHQPFYISTSISTLPTQHTTFLSITSP